MFLGMTAISRPYQQFFYIISTLKTFADRSRGEKLRWKEYGKEGKGKRMKTGGEKEENTSEGKMEEKEMKWRKDIKM